MVCALRRLANIMADTPILTQLYAFTPQVLASSYATNGTKQLVKMASLSFGAASCSTQVMAALTSRFFRLCQMRMPRVRCRVASITSACAPEIAMLPTSALAYGGQPFTLSAGDTVWDGAPMDFALSGTTSIDTRLAYLQGPDGEVIEFFQNEVLWSTSEIDCKNEYREERNMADKQARDATSDGTKDGNKPCIYIVGLCIYMVEIE